MAKGKDKGKGKAVDDERSPLLASEDPEQSSSSGSYDAVSPQISALSRRSRRLDFISLVITSALLLLSLCFLVVLLALLLGYSYGAPASRTTPEELMQHAVRVSGPKEVQVLNVTDAGLWVRIDGWVGVDSDWVMGFRSPDEEEPWWERIRRQIGRWGVREVNEVTVQLSLVEIVSASSGDPIGQVLVPPVTVPLTPSLRQRVREEHDPPRWLSEISIDALVMPSHDIPALIRFAQHAWASGRLELSAKVGNINIQGGGLDMKSWRSYLLVNKEDIMTSIRMKIPTLPGFPSPGTPIEELLSHLSLQSYSVHQGLGSTLTISGNASIPFPHCDEPQFRPFQLPAVPFVVSLLPFPPNSSIDPLPVARVQSSPFSVPPLDTNLTISVNGTLLPVEQPAPLLSSFLSAYVAGRSYPILITSPPPHPGLPPFLSSILSLVKVSYLFPGASPPPRLLKSVAIKKMGIMPSNKKDEFLVSGEINAIVALPEAFSTVSFNVTAVRPDVLIYDGPPLPSDLNAFAQLNAPILAVIQENLTITAPMEDIPVQILPGRDAIFREFVRKVIFNKGGAWAGVKGTSSAYAEVGGVGNITVHGLKVEGGSKVGRGAAWSGMLSMLEIAE